MKRKYLFQATVRMVLDLEPDMLEEAKKQFQDASVGMLLNRPEDIEIIKLGLVDEYQKKL